MKRSYLLIYFLFILIIHATAQLGVRHYRMEEGPDNSKIFTIFKKSNGYIYLGTSNGLYKFDGIKFILVPFRYKVTNSSITAIFEDNLHQLWIGMESGDMGQVLNGIVTLYSPREGTPKQKINAFIQDKQNNIWYATNGEGIYYIRSGHIYNISTDDGLADKYVYTLAIADNGDILAGTDQGISICSLVGNKKVITNLNSKNGLPDNLIKSIEAAGNENFYIGMQDGGICLYNHSTGKFIVPAGPNQIGEINSLYFSEGGLWIGTQANGLLMQNYPGGPMAHIETGSKNSNVNKIIKDREGNIWLLVNNSELIKTPGDQVKLVVDYQPGDFDKVHAVLYDNQSNVFRSTDHGLIKYFHNSDTKKEQVFTISELNEKTSITALYQDLNNHIWIGTMGKGLFMMDASTGKYRHIGESQLLDNGSVLSITGKGNEVFVGSLEGAVYYTLPVSNSIHAPIKSSGFNDLDSFGRNYIYNVFMDSKNRIWFAMDGKYISVLKNGKFVNYNQNNGIKDKVIYSITEDKKGNIWFCTHSAGIYRFDGKLFKNYSLEDGLSDIDISAIKSDQQGNIIIVYKKGIDILNPETGGVWYLNSNIGVKNINVQDLGAVAQDSSGGILVSTTDGILAYHPSKDAIHRPHTVLENIRLFFTDIDPLQKHVFSYDENGFSFSFSGLYYTDPEAIQYQYELEGYENNWLSTKDRTIPFPKLPPGHYTFKVRSSINKIFTESDEASFEFIIEKPFWTTWWFISLCLLIGGSLLYWFIRVRERNVKKVGQLQQEKIKFQFETLRNQVNPHFLFNSFNTLIGIIEDEPKMAVEYVEQLSDFFRNIVTYRDKDVITLKEELRLLQTYFFIQKKRFGNNLALIIEVSESEQLETFIPPLTLQLLTENSIKHNAVSKEAPLKVYIFIKDEFIFVTNNINPKFNKAEGAGMGLQNIVNRYNLLSKREVVIKNDTKNFIVSLPTLKKQS